MDGTAEPAARGRRNRLVCFITGVGHSGSTLLGMILGSNEACFYAGEADKTRRLADPATPPRKRQCKICGADCPVWGGFVPRGDVDLYEQLSERTGKPVVVDSTKDVTWIGERAAEVRRAGGQTALVFLLRDGRAVVSSRLRKSPEADPEAVIRGWVEAIAEARRFFEGWAGPKAAVRYEELATRPGAVTRELCGLLGLPHDAGMVEYYRREHHVLGGNSGTGYLVSRFQRQGAAGPTAAPPGRSRDYYEGHPDGIALDLRWREELGADRLALFEALAGAANADLRWDG